jgi:hypothetical protein
MPKLGLFVVCEKAILEDGTKTPTLVGLFTSVRITVPANNIPPENAAIPKEWAVVCGWDTDNQEEPQQYLQRIEIYYPNQAIFQTGEISLNIEKGKRHYSVVRFQAFPVGQPGRYEVRAWLERNGNPETAKSSFHFSVEHDNQV